MAAVVEVAVAVVAAVVVNLFAILSIAIEPIAGIETDAGVVKRQISLRTSMSQASKTYMNLDQAIDRGGDE